MSLVNDTPSETIISVDGVTIASFTNQATKDRAWERYTATFSATSSTAELVFKVINEAYTTYLTGFSIKACSQTP